MGRPKARAYGKEIGMRSWTHCAVVVLFWQHRVLARDFFRLEGLRRRESHPVGMTAAIPGTALSRKRLGRLESGEA